MTNKLAAMFSLVALGVLIGTWLIRKLAGLPVSEVNDLFGVAVVVFFVSLLVAGPMYARLGISLIKEALAEKRGREEERRRRARERYEAAVDEGSAEG